MGYDRADLTILRNRIEDTVRVSHGACGKTWNQKGNRSGHCGGCHQTFYGVSTFDKHRRDNKCLDPALLKGPWWIDEDSQWHYGERLTDEQKARIWG